MSNLTYIYNPTAITVVLDGRTTTVPASSQNFNDLKQALINKADETAIKKILNIKAYIAQVTEGRAEIVDGKLYFDGAPLAGVLADRVGQMFAEGFGVQPLLRFLNRVAANPRKDIAEELYPFLESGSLPITEDGFVLAYKMVRDNYKDIHSGTMDNSPGSKPSLERYEEVDPNRYNLCSRGLHFASLHYIESGAFGALTPDRRLVVLEIDPADIVSIPIDYNRSKGRAWTYRVVREIDWDERIKANFVDNAYVNGEVLEEGTEFDDELEEDDVEEDVCWVECPKCEEADDDISNRVKKLIADFLGVIQSDVLDNDSFVDDLGADSLDLIEICMILEEEFDCEITDEEAEAITTVGQAIDCIKNKQNVTKLVVTPEAIASAPPSGNSKLTHDDILGIIRLLNEGQTLKFIGDVYNKSPRQIGRIRDGEAWQQYTHLLK